MKHEIKIAGLEDLPRAAKEFLETIEVSDAKIPVVTNVDQNFTEAEVKAFWGSDGSVNLGSTFGTEIDCQVYANLTKTKMNIVIKTKTTLLGKITLTTTRYKLTKQKD